VVNAVSISTIYNKTMPRQVFHPAAFCAVHGIFPATLIPIESGGSAEFNNCVHSCPVCGCDSEIIPGRYEAGSDRLNVLIDPSISPSALAAIRNLAEAVRTGQLSSEDAFREAAKIHPRAATLFDVANWSDQAKATLYAAILGAVAVITAARIASAPSQTVIVNPTVVERVVERAKGDLLASSFLQASGKVPLPRPRPKRR
jgi:hypothetical protein